ncbi:MAG: HAMP domain-containing histidine kinase [Kiritimatiellae bacterium]|nr:HAMP domain-containing histidine kinase [Kiritimatiellia bacterium]
MSSVRKTKFIRSFVFYLTLGYLLVYALCSITIYLISAHGISKSVRGLDRQDVLAESKDLVRMMEENQSGALLAEAVTLKHYPPSTIFIVRVINAKGEVEYTASWPKPIQLPRWSGKPGSLPEEGFSEFYIEQYERYIQIQTSRLKDGRSLQVGKGSFLEVDQRTMLRKLLLIFAILSTLFSVLAAIVLLVITVRPIRKMTDEMSRIIDTGAFETGAPPVNSMINELDTLGHLFNVMTEKYANLIRAMRLTMDNVAHDFRTPLTRIRGGCELAITRGDLPKGLADTLADVIEDCDRAKMQLQNLMDTRAMEIGFSKLNLESLDYCELLSGLADMYSLIAEEKGIRLQTDFPEVPVTGTGDRQRLTRVFANLLDNAVKYTPRGGEVSLSLRQENDNVIVRVADTGIGIPEEERGLIWQRLFRGKKASESEKGLGLGLNIVQVTVTAHHGTIQLESKEGKGTTFTVTLPLTCHG